MATGEIALANNTFGLNLFKALLEENKNENAFVSPFSISVCLAMTQLGARGKTASSMSSSLQWNGKDKVIHDGYQTYISKMQKPCDQYQLSTANRIFIEKKYPVLAEFVEKTKKHYLAEAVSSNFSGQHENERSNINTWVAEQTNDKIKDLLPQGSLNPLTRMVLVNAIYFKGQWENKFEPCPQPQQFKVSPSKSINVPMMTAKRSFGYLQDKSLGCSVLEIPYKGEDLGMVIILPDADFGLEALIGKLTPENLSNLLGGIHRRRQEVKVTMPKFEVSSGFQMKTLLSTLGMAEAFDHSKADFSGMTEGGVKDLYIDDVYHKVFIKVNEEGTEAAAATAVVMRCQSAAFQRPVPVLFIDHPFLVFVVDTSSSPNILFMGQVIELAGKSIVKSSSSWTSHGHHSLSNEYCSTVKTPQTVNPTNYQYYPAVDKPSSLSSKHSSTVQSPQTVNSNSYEHWPATYEIINECN